MRFAILGSGSRGNATLIEAGGSRILIDCGLSLRDLTARLAALGVAPDGLTGVVLTHEHGDHVGGVVRLASRYRLPVWSTPGTWRGVLDALPRTPAPRAPAASATNGSAANDIDVRLFISHGQGFRLGDLRVAPFPVPHDAREPCQFVIEADGQRLGLLTDTGQVTARIRERLTGCDALILETNHDPALLASGPYPASVRARIAGDFGHLSNYQAAALLDRLDHPRLRHLVLAHLSEQNNRPEHARAAILAVDQALAPRLAIAAQDQPLGWFDLSAVAHAQTRAHAPPVPALHCKAG